MPAGSLAQAYLVPFPLYYTRWSFFFTTRTPECQRSLRYESDIQGGFCRQPRATPS